MQSVDSVLGGRKVLIAEDDPLLALDLEDLLHGFGCAVLGPVASVAMAFGVSSSQRPDLVLPDLELQDGRSVPVAQVLGTLGVPTALITGCEGSTDEPPLRSLLRLVKPCSTEALHALLLRLVPGTAASA
ncbi:response regulator [Benzoatithermus flavus]|uniref:Response regulatory domain-containing protein n=1 Tax=Benzoatithermus flavus TaxID=3108223 RepID=A0ABU8XWL4_9PROT